MLYYYYIYEEGRRQDERGHAGTLQQTISEDGQEKMSDFGCKTEKVRTESGLKLLILRPKRQAEQLQHKACAKDDGKDTGFFHISPSINEAPDLSDSKKSCIMAYIITAFSPAVNAGGMFP